MASRTTPEWLSLDIAMAVHDRQLSEHGGPTGVRDQGALESAIGRPVNQWTYGEDDLCAFAAAYAFGIARGHPLADGNKPPHGCARGCSCGLMGRALRSHRQRLSQLFWLLPPAR